MRRTTSITASLALAACLPDGHWKERGPTEPAALADGWEIATPESVGLDPAVLGAIHEDLLREDRNFGTLAFLVVKDGKLVFETYLQTPSDRDVAHHVQSVTESVTSLALGIAHDDGLLPDLDATLGELLPSATFDGLDPQKREISLRHLLTMSSGLDMDNDTFFVELLVDRPSDPLHYVLAKPFYAPPGQEFRYRDASTTSPNPPCPMVARSADSARTALTHRILYTSSAVRHVGGGGGSGVGSRAMACGATGGAAGGGGLGLPLSPHPATMRAARARRCAGPSQSISGGPAACARCPGWERIAPLFAPLGRLPFRRPHHGGSRCRLAVAAARADAGPAG